MKEYEEVNYFRQYDGLNKIKLVYRDRIYGKEKGIHSLNLTSSVRQIKRSIYSDQ